MEKYLYFQDGNDDAYAYPLDRFIGFVHNSNLTLLMKFLPFTDDADSIDTVTLAICKVTPADNVSTALTPTVIDEIAISMPGNNDKLKTINETTITAPSVAAGDLIFPMLKTSGSTPVVYFNVTIELCYDY